MLTELVAGRRRILEVGCGDGRLAAELAAAGHDVTAIDLAAPPTPPAGARFVEGDFMTFTDPGRFEAVLFTRSLHHIAPLDDAVARARGLLVAGGLLVVDDFDLEAPDEATAGWFFAMQGQTGDVARWRAEHEPGLHVGAALIGAVTARFGAVTVTRGPYLHHYLGAAAAAAERAAIADGTLRPVGLRLTAVRAG
jgi:SAM-dependent methyltransferase